MTLARMPVLFIGHGSPMNATSDNEWSRRWAALGDRVGSPKAILSVSAHWYLPATVLTGDVRPRTIHDFGGFPPELYEIEYPAPGAPDVAQRVASLLGEPTRAVSDAWGLDHGTWTVLRRLRPKADVPVVQLSVNSRLAPGQHLELARALAPLRDEGVLIMGSGNVTHNLRHAFASHHAGETRTPPWAAGVDQDIKTALEQHETAPLAHLLDTEAGRAAHPTPDHYLPLLYAAGAADARDAVDFPVTGFDMASLSMRSVLFE
jgi:4,5-DOPA dioxygenase extradiol